MRFKKKCASALKMPFVEKRFSKINPSLLGITFIFSSLFFAAAAAVGAVGKTSNLSTFFSRRNFNLNRTTLLAPDALLFQEFVRKPNPADGA